MPEEGVALVPRREVLSFEEIERVARAAAGLGVTRLRVTGGEPLVRRDIEVLVGMLARIRGVTDLSMTTNGLLLSVFAEKLAEAGLMRVNVSLDATDPDRYRAVTRGGDVRKVMEGIAAARKAGLAPVKLNCVVENGSEEPDARDVAEYARREGLEVRYIRRMDLGSGRFYGVEGGKGGRCSECNRLRLTCNGFVRPCLFSDIAFSVRELGAEEALRRAVESKPRTGGRSSLASIGLVGG